MKQHFVDATGVNRVVFAEEPQQPQPQPSVMSARMAIEEAEMHDGDVTDGESSDSHSAEVDAVEVDRTNIVASGEIPKTVLPEMLRVQEYFER